MILSEENNVKQAIEHFINNVEVLQRCLSAPQNEWPNG